MRNLVAKLFIGSLLEVLLITGCCEQKENLNIETGVYENGELDHDSSKIDVANRESIYDISFKNEYMRVYDSVNSDVMYIEADTEGYLAYKDGTIVKKLESDGPEEYYNNLSLSGGIIWDSEGNDITYLYKNENQKIVSGEIYEDKWLFWLIECQESYNLVEYRLIAKNEYGEEIFSCGEEDIGKEALEKAFLEQEEEYIQYLGGTRFGIRSSESNGTFYGRKILDIQKKEWEGEYYGYAVLVGSQMIMEGKCYDISNEFTLMWEREELQLLNLYTLLVDENDALFFVKNGENEIIAYGVDGNEKFRMDVTGIISPRYEYSEDAEYIIMSFYNEKNTKYVVLLNANGEMMFEPIEGGYAEIEMLNSFDCLLIQDNENYYLISKSGEIKHDFGVGCNAFNLIDNKLIYTNAEGYLCTFNLE